MNYILIYEFDDAPQNLQMLSIHGGDEDYVVIIPNYILEKNDNYIMMFEGMGFYSKQVAYHEDYPDCTIYISSH